MSIAAGSGNYAGKVIMPGATTRSTYDAGSIKRIIVLGY